MPKNLKNIPLKISESLNALPALHNALREIYCYFAPGIRATIKRTFASHKNIVVLKIGANDGVASDQLAEFLLSDTRFEGVLVEPIPKYAAFLKANFHHTNRFRIIEAAIAEADGSRDVYFFDEDAAKAIVEQPPTWFRGIASLSRQHVEKHLPENLWRAVRAQKVESLSVSTLLQRQNMSLVNMIHIDTEGADYLILKQFEFSKLRPEIVLYEHKHLPMDQKMAASSLMRTHGYRVKELEVDCLCVRNDQS
jgi:FkbM family methyltransferase